MKRFVLIVGWIASVVVSFFLGDYFSFTDTATPGISYGRFLGNPKTEWLDERDMRMLDDFIYIDPNNIAWLAPKGSVINGASIPPVLWSWIGSPFVGRYRNASIVHDATCEQREKRYQDVHRMFFDACLAGGVPEKEAKRLYWAVARYGPRWELKPRFSVSARPNGEEETTMVVTAEPIASNEPTDEEIRWAEKYFIENDPTLEQVETLINEPPLQ